ncbi:hypothetical protein N6H18_11485 [Reichenbachiella agarivorans]|uniref:Uncharacterized protein n=1 Tax=Reichenbachiella agarivorans TaxID=2979464 RepID=A0ABY6CKF4_9BACT|nr:hypothetical protein [Reichenbachiella agarivorans]UXP30972.1 hypothetical protein N6H18_11485 [Reichenbachiella agarivorans]
MVVWSGRGILSVLVLLLSFVGFIIVLPKGYELHAVSYALLITGIFSWFLGKRWNNHPGRIIIDKNTGEKINLKTNHSIFWIPMQYWGILFTLLGLWILYLELFGSGTAQ